MGNAPMMPLPPPPEEAEVEEFLGALPVKTSEESSLSKPVAVPGRKLDSDPTDEDHSFVHTVGSPTSVVDLFDFCNKSNWRRQGKLDESAQQETSEAQALNQTKEASKLQPCSSDSFELLTDDLILHIMDFLDVKSAIFVFGPSCRRGRALAREWFPWRCMEMRHWLTLPNHRTKIWEVYRRALDQSDACLDRTREDRLTRRIRLSNFLGNAGLYRQGEELLSSALFDGADMEIRADQQLALAYVRWRAQQARHGGDEGFLWGIVAAALESVEIRRALPGRHQARKLALALEVLAENAACYGHCLVAMSMEGVDTGAEAREGSRRLLAPFDLAQDAVRECVDLWVALGDDEKLADAWAASAAVDFYAGRNLEGALAKLALAQAMCVRSRRLLHPTHALVLFNLAYISLVAFGRAAEAAGLFARSLAVREAILGPEHPFTLATRSELVACLRLLREEESAGRSGGTAGSIGEVEEDEDEELQGGDLLLEGDGDQEMASPSRSPRLLMDY